MLAHVSETDAVQWLVDDALRNDGCTSWLASKHPTSHRVPQQQGDDLPRGNSEAHMKPRSRDYKPDGDPSAILKLPSLAFLNDVAVCQSRQWGHRLLRVLTIPLLQTVPPLQRAHGEAQPMMDLPHWAQRRAIADSSNTTETSESAPTALCLQPSMCEDGVRVHIDLTEHEASGLLVSLRNPATVTNRTSREHRQPDASWFPPPLASLLPWGLPFVFGYIHPLFHWDDHIRFLVTSLPQRHVSLPSNWSSQAGGARTIATSWKGRGTASLSQQSLFAHVQFWPEAWSPSRHGSSSFASALRSLSASLWSEVSCFLHTTVRPLHANTSTRLWSEWCCHDCATAASETQRPPTSWIRHHGAKLSCTPLCNPRASFWVGLDLSRPYPNTIVREVAEPLASSAICPSAGVTYDSTPQRMLGGSVWRMEGGAHVATTSQQLYQQRPSRSTDRRLSDVDAVSYTNGTGLWVRGTLERLVSIRRRRSSPLDCTSPTDPTSLSAFGLVCRIRWLAAWQHHAPLLIPRGLARGAVFGCTGKPTESIVATGYDEKRITTTRHALAAVSLEAEVPHVLGSGANATLFCNLLTLDPLAVSRSSALLWSAGYAIGPGHGRASGPEQMRRHGRLTEWNRWVPQRMECSFPVVTGATSRVDGSAPSPWSRGVTWMPSCGFVWEL
jgi:hypothetical protein